MEVTFAPKERPEMAPPNLASFRNLGEDEDLRSLVSKYSNFADFQGKDPESTCASHRCNCQSEGAEKKMGPWEGCFG